MISTLIRLLLVLLSAMNVEFGHSLPIRAAKTALVTGSTDGIGLTTAKNLAAKGYNLILHGRDATRIQKAEEEVKSFCSALMKDDSPPKAIIKSIRSDISTIAGCKKLVSSVRSLLKENDMSSLDLLVNNAGVFEESYQSTMDGLEMTFAVNVMAPFVITSNLLPELTNARNKENQSRIVIASSISQCSSIDHWDDLQCHTRPYNTHQAYAESKFLDALLSAEFASRLIKVFGAERITCNCLDPGTVNTKMLIAGWGPCGIDVGNALDETWLSTSEDINDVSGTYFCSRRPSKEINGYRISDRKKLWNVLAEIDSNSSEIWEDLSV